MDDGTGVIQCPLWFETYEDDNQDWVKCHKILESFPVHVAQECKILSIFHWQKSYHGQLVRIRGRFGIGKYTKLTELNIQSYGSLTNEFVAHIRTGTFGEVLGAAIFSLS